MDWDWSRSLWMAAPALGVAFGIRWGMRRFSDDVRLFAGRLVAGDRGVAFRRRLRGPLGEAQDALEAMARQLEGEGRLTAQTLRKQARALQGMSDGVLICGEGGEVLLMNASFRALLGAAPPAALDYKYEEAFDEPVLKAALEGALKENKRSAVELKVLGGGERSARAVVTPFDHPGSDGGGAIALVFDQTEEKRLERMRSEFVSNVSHELRTPLTAIKAALETLRDGALEDPKVNRSFLDKALHHSDRLQELIADILALSSIEEQRRLGTVDTGARCSALEVVKEALASLEESLKRHQGSVEVHLPEGLPALHVDPAALRQALVNLIENALKYTGPQPCVAVSAEAGTDWVELSVADQGPGIPAADQPRVFERFYRVDKARARASGGSGLGLAIVKHLAEAHGGSVGLESREGQGSRFWIRLKAVTGN